MDGPVSFAFNLGETRCMRALTVHANPIDNPAARPTTIATEIIVIGSIFSITLVSTKAENSKPISAAIAPRRVAFDSATFSGSADRLRLQNSQGRADVRMLIADSSKSVEVET